MHPLIEEHGKEVIGELLDIFVIAPNAEHDWKSFAQRHGIVKKSTKTVRGRIRKTHVDTEYKSNGYTTERVLLDEPYDSYNVFLRNGRNQTVFSLKIKSTEINQLLEELK